MPETYRIANPGLGKDLTGITFDRLLVLESAAPVPTKQGKNRRAWLCECQCPSKTRVVVLDNSLRTGNSTSCGCKGKEKAREGSVTHGEGRKGKQTKEYRLWCSIIARCENPKHKFWNRYGGRGIKMHPEWRASYEAFLRDVGRAPSPKHSIDRFPDNEGNYQPGNIRWATAKMQVRNSSKMRWITFGGRTQSLGDWAGELGIHHVTLINRIDKWNWPIEKALTTPAMFRRSS